MLFRRAVTLRLQSNLASFEYTLFPGKQTTLKIKNLLSNDIVFDFERQPFLYRAVAT